MKITTSHGICVDADKLHSISPITEHRDGYCYVVTMKDGKAITASMSTIEQITANRDELVSEIAVHKGKEKWWWRIMWGLYAVVIGGIILAAIESAYKH